LLKAVRMNTNPKANQAAIVLFGIAGLLLASIVTHSWFAADDGGIGLLGLKRCMAHGCESQFWFSVNRAPGSIVLLALLGLGAGLTAIGMLGHTAIMLTRGTPNAARTSGTNIALAVTLFSALVFLVRIASEDHHGLHLGWSGIACLVAATAGLVVMKQMVSPLVVPTTAALYVPPMPVQQGAPSSHPIPAFPLTMQDGMNRMHGHVFLAQGRLYFVCVKTGGAWLAAIGQGVGGLVGGALAGLAMPTVDGAPAIYDETQLHRAVSTMPGSLVMEAQNIQQIKETWAWRLIRANGKKYGLPKGLGRDLKAALGPWARYHQVRTVGFA
jgi:hypothetical protein